MFKTTLKKSILFAAIAMAASTAMAADPIRIGSVLSVSGPAAFLGEPELKTLQLYVDKINAEGGVLGRKLELVHYDDGSDAAKANSFTKRLIESDKVDVLIGGTTTGATMAMAPLVDKASLPFISLAGAVVVIDPVKKWVFKTPHTDRMAAEKVFEDMKKRGISKVGCCRRRAALAPPAARKPRPWPPNTASPWSPMKPTARKTPTSPPSSPASRAPPACRPCSCSAWARARPSSPRTTASWPWPRCRCTSRTAWPRTNT